MDVKWMVAPWMRRRIARHVERGTSERVIACLIGSIAPASASESDGVGRASWDTSRNDLSNVIPFRTVALRSASSKSVH